MVTGFLGILLGAVLKSGGEPVKTLVETITTRRRGTLDVPDAVLELAKTKTLGNLLDLHRTGQILLVGEDKQDGVTELILGKHALELIASRVLIALGVIDTITVVRVDHEDDTLGVLVVVAPEGTDLVLASDVPHGEGNVLVLDGLNVETDGRDGRNDVTQLELVKDGGLTCSIQTDHQNAHLLLAEESAPELGKGVSHDSIAIALAYQKINQQTTWFSRVLFLCEGEE